MYNCRSSTLEPGAALVRALKPPVLTPELACLFVEMLTRPHTPPLSRAPPCRPGKIEVQKLYDRTVLKFMMNFFWGVCTGVL